ncbi:HlyD family efflux transporter periplasmic adaptor subunit [Niallia circulans]|uniref:efflux RND transporter periplasmic adaptor subunit n=1 Tax=Niallia circulans TaxID=1397 RepID=UPI00203A7A8B|nr:HlyD family efflux transporter periplasmic adaptor subunit [Niallia circulans]MCM2981718.1 HlyD family efflux transporter periplasmic adaptor subunit [Niallia circulans]
MKKSIKKWIISGVTVLVIGTGIGSYYYFSNDNQTEVRAQARTQTATAEAGDVEIEVSGTGSIAAINKETFTAEGNATVDEVLVEAGDKVEKGDELVTFENDTLDPIVATFSGEITALNVEEDGNVSMGTEIVTVTDYDNLEMVVNVDELDISKVKAGQAVNVKVSALEDKEFTGKVTSVAKEANSDSTSVAKYAVAVKITKPSGLLVGMTAEATITTDKAEDVVTVPVEAVQKENDEYYVLVANGTNTNEDDTKETASTKQTVEVGLQNTEVAEIKSGLEEGTTVVLPTFESSSDSEVQGMFPGGGQMPNGEGRGQMPGGGQGGGMPAGGFGGRNE